jgi:hypothetical protein
VFGGDLRGTARSKQCVGKFLAAVGFREPPRGGVDQSQTLHRGQVRLTLTQRRVPALSGLLPTLPGIPRIRLSPASIGPLRRPNGEDSHPSRPPGASWRTQQRSTATTPTNTVSMCPPTARDVPIQPPSTALPTVRDEEALGSNPATSTPGSTRSGALIAAPCSVSDAGSRAGVSRNQQTPS